MMKTHSKPAYFRQKYDSKYLSKYPFFNTIPFADYITFNKEDFMNNTSNYFTKLPKNYKIYAKNVDSQIDCNFILAKAAYPEYFPSDSKKIIEKILKKKIDEENIQKFDNINPAISNLYRLIQQREAISFEKQSFENSNSKSFYQLFHPKADRSSARKKEILSNYNKLSTEINEIIKNNEFDFLYLSIIEPEYVTQIQNFFNGEIPLKSLQNKSSKLLPKTINPRFYNELIINSFTVYFCDNEKKESVSINQLFGCCFSNILSASKQNTFEINVKNSHESAEMMRKIITKDKVIFKFQNYPILKELSEKLDSDYLKELLKRFDKKLIEFNNAIKQANMFIEIQDRIFDLNEDNFLNTSYYIKSIFETPYFINEVAHQIEVASKLRPKSNQIYQKFYEEIKNQINNDFKCKVDQVNFTEIEKIIIDDDLSSLQTYVNENLKLNINGEIKCNHFPYNDKTLINVACFYGSINCFKFLLSNEAIYDQAKLFYYAIAGGNIQIIHILNENVNGKISGSCEYAAKYYQNEILEWLIEQELDDKSFLLGASEANNFKAAIFYLYSNFSEMIDSQLYSFPSQYHNHNFGDDSVDIEFAISTEKAVSLNHESYLRFLLNFPNICLGSIAKESVNSLNLDLIELSINLESNVNRIDIYKKYVIKSILTGDIEIISKVFENKNVKQIFSEENCSFYSYSYYSYPNAKFEERIFKAAIKTKNMEIIEYILSMNKVCNVLYRPIRDYKEISDQILKTRDENIIQKFIHHGNIFTRSNSIEQLIQELISQGDIELILKIVDKNYFKYRRDWSPFPYARTVKTVQFLLECESLINYCNSDGETCLSNAINNNNKEIVKLLLENGAKIRPNDLKRATKEIQNIFNQFSKSVKTDEKS